MSRTSTSTSLLLAFFLGILTLLGGCGRGGGRSSLLQRQSGHPILLVRAPAPTAADELWVQILERTLGGCDVLNASSMAPGAVGQIVKGRALIVFSHSSLTALDTLAAKHMAPFFDAGGLALLDTPDAGWATTAGLRKVGTRLETQLPWPRLRSSFGPLLRGGETQGPSSTIPPFHMTPLSLRHERWIHRPEINGVRVRLSPFGRPAVWWTPHSAGGWLAESLSLPDLVDGIRRQKKLTPPQREEWEKAVENALLDPDAFPLPWPRVWTAPFSETPQPTSSETWDQLRRSVQLRPRWLSEDQLEIAVRRTGLKDLASDQRALASQIAIAVPVRWHGKTLADWNASWPDAQGRRTAELQRSWQLVSFGGNEGRLILDYRPTREALRWH